MRCETGRSTDLVYRVFVSVSVVLVDTAMDRSIDDRRRCKL
jgi:hypothetical protein